jgi:hypothetical protein
MKLLKLHLLRQFLVLSAGLFFFLPQSQALCTLNLDIEGLQAAQCPGVDATKFEYFKSKILLFLYRDKLVQTNYASCFQFQNVVNGTCSPPQPAVAVFSSPKSTKKLILKTAKADLRRSDVFDKFDPNLRARLISKGISTAAIDRSDELGPTDHTCNQVGRRALNFDGTNAYFYECGWNGLIYGAHLRKFTLTPRTHKINQIDESYLRYSEFDAVTPLSLPAQACNNSSTSCLNFSAPLFSQSRPELISLINRKTGFKRPSDVGFCGANAMSMALFGLSADSQGKIKMGESVDNGSAFVDSYDQISSSAYAGGTFSIGSNVGTDWFNGGTSVTSQNVIDAGLASVLSPLPLAADGTSNYTFSDLKNTIDTTKGYLYLPVSYVPGVVPGHALTVSGYSGDNVRMLDPWGRVYLAKVKKDDLPIYYYTVISEPPNGVVLPNGLKQYAIVIGANLNVVTVANGYFNPGKKIIAPRNALQNGLYFSDIFDYYTQLGYFKKLSLGSTNGRAYLEFTSGDLGYLTGAENGRAYLTKPETSWVVSGKNAGPSFEAARSQEAADILFGIGQRAKGLAQIYLKRKLTPSEMTELTAAAKSTSTLMAIDEKIKFKFLPGTGAPLPPSLFLQFMNGICDTANGTPTLLPPTANLCSAGTASVVSTFSNHYSWKCAGSGGLSSASCQAPRILNGTCGSDNGVATTFRPFNLCSAGVATPITTGDYDYTWTCTGVLGGTSQSCKAPLLGQCGPSSYQWLRQAPTTGLCTTGKPSLVTTSAHYSWTCGNSKPGSGQCSASKATDGVCGLAKGTTQYSLNPSSGLCASGIPSAITTGTSSFTWSCTGTFGAGPGAPGSISQFCSANRLIPGNCGSAYGSITSVAPSSATALCVAGTPSAVVTSSTQHSWTCSGSTFNCVAYQPSPTIVVRGKPGACGSAANVPTVNSPSGILCSGGYETAVTKGASLYTWTCKSSSTIDLTSANCSAPIIVPGVCGSANNVASYTVPTANLCSVGTASATMTEAGKFSWSCSSTNGGVSTNCSANRMVAGSCGAANNVVSTTAPSTNLCNAGVPSYVGSTFTFGSSAGFSWTCAGTNGGSVATCAAPKVTDAACGRYQNRILSTPPTAGGGMGLCSVGTASAVITNAGTYNWSCTGFHGGADQSCFATRMISGSCGVSNASPTPISPLFLCLVGTPSNVSTYTDAYHWTCGGINGGSTLSCSAPRIIDADCGTAVQLPSAVAPSTNLCLSGSTASAVTIGTDAFSWTCSGSNTTSTPYCSSPRIISGSCGMAAGVATTVAPSQLSLCANGLPGAVSFGTSAFTWSCAGANGGTSPSCSAPRIVAGTCGAATTISTTTAPVNNLCGTGIASAVTTSTSSFGWTCAGINGAASATCSVSKAITGVCGSANNIAITTIPVSGLCSVGTPTAVTSVASRYNWSCLGSGGGGSGSCSAPTIVNGSCGSANNMAVASAPTTSLCNSGNPSLVASGLNSFTWTCSGLNGGSSPSCAAPKVIAGACGPAHTVSVALAPNTGLCSAGNASIVTAGATSFSWICNGVNGGANLICAAPKLVVGSCGTANGVSVATAPASGLCSSGTASTVLSGASSFTWNCSGSGGGASPTCSAPKIISASCGSATTVAVTSSPTTNLCLAGTASAVTAGTTNFSWTCTGSSGSATASCSTTRMVAGSCGAANGVATATTPTTSLCSYGSSTAVTTGATTYTWSCAGTGGGASAACVATRRIAGVCGPSNGILTAGPPVSGFCSAGTASSLGFDGINHTWSCAGIGGGTTSYCSAPHYTYEPGGNN